MKTASISLASCGVITQVNSKNHVSKLLKKEKKEP